MILVEVKSVQYVLNEKSHEINRECQEAKV